MHQKRLRKQSFDLISNYKFSRQVDKYLEAHSSECLRTLVVGDSDWWDNEETV